MADGPVKKSESRRKRGGRRRGGADDKGDGEEAETAAPAPVAPAAPAAPARTKASAKAAAPQPSRAQADGVPAPARGGGGAAAEKAARGQPVAAPAAPSQRASRKDVPRPRDAAAQPREVAPVAARVTASAAPRGDERLALPVSVPDWGGSRWSQPAAEPAAAGVGVVPRPRDNLRAAPDRSVLTSTAPPFQSRATPLFGGGVALAAPAFSVAPFAAANAPGSYPQLAGLYGGPSMWAHTPAAGAGTERSTASPTLPFFSLPSDASLFAP